MKKILLFFPFVFSTAVFSNSDVKEAYSQVIEGKAIIVDVREKHEVDEGIIKRAEWLALSKVQSTKSWEKNFKKLAKDKKVFLYCRSGKRAEKVRKILSKKAIEAKNIGGYENLKRSLPTEVL